MIEKTIMVETVVRFTVGILETVVVVILGSCLVYVTMKMVLIVVSFVSKTVTERWWSWWRWFV